MPPASGTTIGDLSNDDYVAQVLANEAHDNSLKYSAQGLEVYRPKRPTGGAPKPNTRFLRHIIRETDNHNASLKRKEEREARERMRQLRKNAHTDATTSSRDHRRLRRDELDRERRDDRRERHRSHRRSSRERDRSRRHRRHESYDSDENRRRSSRKDKRSDGYGRRRHRSYSRSRSRSPRRDRDRDRDRHHRSSHRISPTRSRSRERARTKYNESHRSREHNNVRHREPTLEPANPSDPESDPLEDIVGPLPAKEEKTIRSRGRGAYKPNSSNIDAHFAPDYDPTLDVHLEDEDAAPKPTRRPVAGLMTGDDDWELALEALRDRANWRQKGEERLREAGFNDSVVERWKNNAAPGGDDEGRLEDVKWSKKGEGREWDRGKFINDEGSIDVKASWG